MQIGVVGLWHLGCVTAASLCKVGYSVVAYDSNTANILSLKDGKAPIFEPHLETLLNEAVESKKIVYTDEAKHLKDCEIVWVTFDTPVDDMDNADVLFIQKEIEKIVPHLKENVLVLISSQLPVGTTQKFQNYFGKQKHIHFAYLPENLRLGKAIDVFMKPERIVVGVDHADLKNKIQIFLKPFCENIIWMSVPSAEMTKHAINSFLALSVTFINELASLCERVGANGYEVEQGLKSEERIGQKAYLHPGDSIAGGTLMRDVNFLIQLGINSQKETNLISAIVKSNKYHQNWAREKISLSYETLKGKNVAILGLTYKPNTNTLRRSSALETCEWLFQKGCHLTGYDPAIDSLPQKYSHMIDLKKSRENAVQFADAIIIATPWPEFCALTPEDILQNENKKVLVLDPSGCIAKKMKNNSHIHYHSVGYTT